VSTENTTFNAWNNLSFGSGDGVVLAFANCIIANIVDNDHLGITDAAAIVGDYNGFYHVTNAPIFGVHQFTPNFYPFFESVGGGNHYLANGSGFQDKGTYAITPAVLARLYTQTTRPPDHTSYVNQSISWDAYLSPLGLADTGAPDLGYETS